MLYRSMQDKNEVVLSGRQEGGQPWADAASARAPMPPLGEYQYTEPPECPMQPPGTAMEMENGFRRLPDNERDNYMMEIFSGPSEDFMIPRNNYSRRSV